MAVLEVMMMNNMASDEKQLYDLIADSLNVQISFRHRDFFDNRHVESIFANTDLLNKFQRLLFKVENNVKPEYEDGTVLRNMLELIVLKWQSRFKLDSKDVRNFLNNKKSEFVPSFPWQYEDWLNAFNQFNHLPVWSDRGMLIKWYINNGDDPSDAKKKADKTIQCSFFLLEGIMTSCYRSQNTPPGLPPKYIFSYIDNIYTVTSEWSSHGKNLKTTKPKEFTLEGWKALVFGMCQILQWMAKENPNPPSYQN